MTVKKTIMKNTAKKQTSPINNKETVANSNDKHIDQDFKGYPNSPAKENNINPVTKEDKLTAKTEKPATKDTRGKSSAKANDKKPGEPDSVEKTLANNLGGNEKVPGQPNQANKLRKEKNG